MATGTSISSDMGDRVIISPFAVQILPSLHNFSYEISDLRIFLKLK